MNREGQRSPLDDDMLWDASRTPDNAPTMVRLKVSGWVGADPDLAWLFALYSAALAAEWRFAFLCDAGAI